MLWRAKSVSHKNVLTTNVAGSFFIINEGDGYCDCGSHEPIPYVPEEQSNYMMYPSISIHKATRLDDLEKIAIEGVSLITYEHSSELPQQTLAMLFEHINIFQ